MSELRSTSPAEPEREIGRFEVADPAAIEAAVGRARSAFPAWRDLGLDRRVDVLVRFRDLANGRVNELAELIALESGKALWDARGEARLLGAKVDVTLAEGMEDVAVRAVGKGIRATHHPRGVLAVLGPFNFPAHLPNGHIVPALATGNCVVFKPSELTPAVGQWMKMLWRDAGLPEGVLEVVHGEADTGRALAKAPDVDGVLFTGSYSTGRALQESLLDDPHKILALELGGRNAIAVLADADLELAVAETALSIAVSTGQRCSCASRIFIDNDIIDEFTHRLSSVLRRLRIGHPMENDVFMGPLASTAGSEKVARFRALSAETAGERVLLVEPDLPPPYVGPGLVVFPDTCQDHVYQREEIFGPEAALYPIEELDEAIAAINDSEYGLVASIFTKEPRSYEHCVGRVQTGLLNWNKGTTGASGKLPFGGLGKSGNDRPAGVSSALYCTFPQSHLESRSGIDLEALPPGFPRNLDGDA